MSDINDDLERTTARGAHAPDERLERLLAERLTGEVAAYTAAITQDEATVLAAIRAATKWFDEWQAEQRETQRRAEAVIRGAFDAGHGVYLDTNPERFGVHPHRLLEAGTMLVLDSRHVPLPDVPLSMFAGKA